VVEGKLFMKNIWEPIIVITMSIFLLLQSVTAQSKYLFHIPVFPGTTLFHTEISNSQEINLPFITFLRVYRTTNGSSLNVDTVISFYESHFKGKGWKESIDKRIPPEPYVAFRVDVFENLINHVQVSGNISFWIAPRDGMLTVFCEQWRISGPNTQTRDRVTMLLKTLTNLAEEFYYKMEKIYYTSQWLEYYENEYLIDCSASTLFDTHIKHHSCMDTEGMIDATILTYKDSTIAHAEAERIREQWNDNIGVETSRLGPNAFLVDVCGLRINGLIQFNNILLLLSDLSGKQKSQITTILKRIKQEID
jgi:hypothetical protein